MQCTRAVFEIDKKMAEDSAPKTKFFCEICQLGFHFASKYQIHLTSANHRALEEIININPPPENTPTDCVDTAGSWSPAEAEDACTEEIGRHASIFFFPSCVCSRLTCVDYEYVFVDYIASGTTNNGWALFS